MKLIALVSLLIVFLYQVNILAGLFLRLVVTIDAIKKALTRCESKDRKKHNH